MIEKLFYGWPIVVALVAVVLFLVGVAALFWPNGRGK